MKVLLAYLCHYRDRHDYYLSMLPVGVVSIAACLEKKGFDVTLANFSKMGYRTALQHITRTKPDVIGLSLFTHNRIDSFKLVQELKKVLPKTAIVLGGPHATFLADEIIRRYKEVDYIIKGEGEKSFVALMKKIERGETSDRKVLSSQIIEDLNDLPAPGEFSGNLIGVDTNEQFAFIITSRGCPHACIFCSSPQFWKRTVQYRSAESVFREIKQLHERYGIIYFSIRDDNFTLNKRRVLQFTDLVQKSGLCIMWNCQARVDTIDEEMLIEMKRAGLEHIQYGVESGSERILKLYDKHTTIDKIEQAAAITRKVGVYLSIYLMTGMEGEKQQDTDETKSLIRRTLPHDGIVSPVALYPGTQLYERVKKKRTITDDVWFKKSASGIYLRNDEKVDAWMAELLIELERIKKKSWYREKDFAKHRKVAGEDCWVTDILEGDYFCYNKRYREAEKCYQRVIDRYPQNPWGYLKMAELQRTSGDLKGAEQQNLKVKKIMLQAMRYD
ncbi:MAG: cobalamin-dependent protein [Proteobacteria bacterium]|nr:cobalamin-dependent protein [Pseudomonadota bacterium]